MSLPRRIEDMILLSEDTDYQTIPTLFDHLPDEIFDHILTYLIPDYISITRPENWWKKYFHPKDEKIKGEVFGFGNSQNILTLLSLSSLNKSRFRIDLNKYWHKMFNACFKISSLVSTRVTIASANMRDVGDWDDQLYDANIFGRYYVAKEIGYLHDLEALNQQFGYTFSDLPEEMHDIGDQNDIDNYMKHQMDVLDTEYEPTEDYLIRLILEMFNILRYLKDPSAYFTSTVMVEMLPDEEKLDMSAKSLEVLFPQKLKSEFWNEWKAYGSEKMKNFLFAKIQLGKNNFGDDPIIFPENIIDVTIEQNDVSTPTFIFPNVRHLTLQSSSATFWNLFKTCKFPKLKSLKLIVPVETRFSSFMSLLPQLDCIRVEYTYYDFVEEVTTFLQLEPKYSLSYNYPVHPRYELGSIPKLYHYGATKNIRVSLNDSTFSNFYSLTFE